MKAFSKRETLRESIALTALMVALNVVLNAANSYIPFAGYFLASFLPLVSTIYVLNVKLKYYPYYFVASMALGIATTATNFSDTLLYLLPSLISGIFYALCVKGKFDTTMAFFCSSIVLFVCEISLIPLVNFIYNTDTIYYILSFFAIQNLENIYLFVYAGLFLVASLKEFFVFLITKDELTKFSYKMRDEEHPPVHMNVLTFTLSLLTFTFVMMEIYTLSFLFLAIALVATLVIAFKLMRAKRIYLNVIILISFVLAWIDYVLLYQFGGNALKSMISLLIFPIVLSITGLMINLKDIIDRRISNEEKAQ